MNFRLSLLFVVLSAASVPAEVSENWYVATGADAPARTTFEEEGSQTVFAGITGVDQNGNAVKFGITCFAVQEVAIESPTLPRVSYRAFLSGRLRGTGGPNQFFGTFDGKETAYMGMFQFVESSFEGELRPEFLTMLSQHRSLEILSEDRNSEVLSSITTVSLKQAAEAIGSIHCRGELKP